MQDNGGEYDQEGGLNDIYTNNHDLIGLDGIIRSQKNEIEKKKVSHHQF